MAKMYLAAPAVEGPRPGVLLFQEAFGVNEHIRSVADRLAARGYAVAAPSLFHRQGIDTIAYDAHQEAVALTRQLSDEQVLEDAAAAYEQLTTTLQADPARIVTIGYCFGGRCAFLTATELALAGAVSFYGPGITGSPEAPIARAAGLRAPVLFFFGRQDPLIPESARTALAEALTLNGKQFEVVVYDDAGHAFFNEMRPDRYQPTAAADAWKRTMDFLDARTGRS